MKSNRLFALGRQFGRPVEAQFGRIFRQPDLQFARAVCREELAIILRQRGAEFLLDLQQVAFARGLPGVPAPGLVGFRYAFSPRDIVGIGRQLDDVFVAAILVTFVGGIESLVLPLREMIAQDRRAQHAAVLACVDPLQASSMASSAAAGLSARSCAQLSTSNVRAVEVADRRSTRRSAASWRRDGRRSVSRPRSASAMIWLLSRSSA